MQPIASTVDAEKRQGRTTKTVSAYHINDVSQPGDFDVSFCKAPYSLPSKKHVATGRDIFWPTLLGESGKVPPVNGRHRTGMLAVK